ncbi:MAG: HAD-IA family hydrolase [Mogibacterium sp.]|nr:HAD-IA family hydrolase [Mogibacterium sp.]
MIRNIVFDIGNVLIGFDAMDYLVSLFGREKAMRIAEAVFGSGYWQELDIARLSEEEILELFYSGAPDLRAEIKESFDRIGECVRKLDWPVPLVDSLKEKGYGVYFLSNMSEHVKASNTAAFDFVSRMDGGIWSCDVHEIKPDAGIYGKLFEKYGLVPEECLFIDDHKENIDVGKKLGMKGIVFRDHDQLMADLDKALTKDASHDMITVLCYGDSNTYGYDPQTCGRYPYDKRWTTLLGEMLGNRYEVISEGLNGRTTAYDRPGAAWKNGMSCFTACLGTHKPVDFVIIMLGTNDCDKELGLSAGDIADGMEKLVSIIEEETPVLQGYVPEIIVAAPAAIQGDIAKSPFADKLTAGSVQKSLDIGPLYREIAERHGVKFADATKGIEVAPDCEHLTEEGHRQIAGLFCETIKAGL